MSQSSDTVTQTLSLTGRPWVFAEHDERHMRALMQQHELPEVLARILSARGVGTDEAAHFLNPSLKQALPDPSHLLDMDAAAERVAGAVAAGGAVWGFWCLCLGGGAG